MNVLIQDMELVWSKIKPVLEAIGAEIWIIFKRIFTAEEAVIMSQLYGMLKNDAVALQNAQPGISAKDAEGILKTNATAALAGLGVELAYTAIVTTVGAVMHDLGMSNNTGNAGVVTTGTSTTTAS